MAAQEAPDSQVHSPKNPFLFYSLIDINRACRLKPAGAGKPRRHIPFVRSQNPEERALHRYFPNSPPGRPFQFMVRRVSAADSPHCDDEFIAQVAVRSFRTGPLGVDDEIEVIGKVGRGFSEYLPEQALHTVADYGSTDLARNRDSQALMIQVVLPREKHEPSRVELPSGAVYGSVIRSPHYSMLPRETLTACLNHSLSAFCVPWRAAASTPACRPWLPFWI